MHSTNLQPAGKGVLLESLADGEYVRTKVVEPVAVRLVDEGVYTGYSVGIARPRIDRDPRARAGRIVAGKIVEVSLVDRPALPSAKFAVLKMQGATLAFVGKAVMVDEEPVAAIELTRGMRVTVEANDDFGTPHVYEGRIVQQGQEAFSLDLAGFSKLGGVKRFQRSDVTVHKGSRSKRASDARGGTGSDATVRHGSESEAALDAADTTKNTVAEDSVADDQPTAVKAADGMAQCDKCSGAKTVNGAECEKCHGSGQMTVEKGEAADEAGTAPDDKDDGEPDADDKPGAATSGGGDDADDLPSGSAAKVAATELHVEKRDTQWVVVKGEVVLGTHATEGAADGQRDAIVNDSQLVKRAENDAAEASKAAQALLPPAEDGDEIPWLLRRAHDFTCPAYKTADVAEAYPSIEKTGMVDTLGPTTRTAIYAALANEVRKDAGTGEGAERIEYLSKALSSLQELLGQDDPVATGGILLAARDQLHDAFKAANSGATIPKPSESISASQFRRPYLKAGHQTQAASARPARIPTTTHPVSPSDFDRGALTEGHQRYLAQKMVDVHDALASWQPELCRMDAAGSNAFDRQPAESFQRPPVVPHLPNGATGSPTSLTPTPPAKAPGEKADVPDTNTITVPTIPLFEFGPAPAPVVKALTEEDIAEVVKTAQAPFITQLTKLQADYEALASSPDPSRSAIRGVTTQPGFVAKTAQPDVTKVERQARRDRKRAEKVSFYQSLSRSGDAEQRIYAQERLAGWGVEATD